MKKSLHLDQREATRASTEKDAPCLQKSVMVSTYTNNSTNIMISAMFTYFPLFG